MLSKTFLFVLTFCSTLYLTKLQENAGLTVEDICKQAQENCKTCIQAHPMCTWCFQITNQTKQGTRQMRCQILSVNEQTCPQFIENPVNVLNETKNEPFSNVTDDETFAISNVIQLRPQKLDLMLRQGHPQTINITFRRVIDYPLDLYYVMDLSYSMRDDLQTLQTLGSSLVDGIKSLTNNVGLGFGTFVDKVMLPYTSTVEAQLQDPCSNAEDDSCAPVFGFRHQLPITTTADGSAFIQAVNSTQISGNIDSPEGGFDALMQIAVCQEDIAWRDGSLRVILFTSDASPHVAMDGKLAAILEKNDMQCHLETGVHEYYPSSTVYASSKILDYPSVGQLKKAFNEQKIQPVFAVTKEVFPLYAKLQTLLDPAYADILDSDSQNVITLISSSYNQIRSKVQLNNPNVPENVEMNYRVLCPDADSWVEGSLECNNVSIGNEVVFQFDIESKGCPEGVRRDSIEINSNSIQDVVSLNIEYLCDCGCVDDSLENHTSCSHKGSLECGICECEDGILGLQCQCPESATGIPLEQNCTDDNAPEGSPLCNSDGFCECGTCQCNEGFYGTYCECRNSGCKDIDGAVCGGLERGRCENCNNQPRCICEGDWEIDDNDLCSCNEMLCRVNGTGSICSESGTCSCDTCVCDQYHDGSYCRNCIHPICVGYGGTCSSLELSACAECVYNAERLNQETVTECKEECIDRNIKFTSVDSLPDCNNCLNGIQEEICPLCNTFSRDPSVHLPISCESNPFSTCILQYRIVWDIVQQQYAVFVKNFIQEDCPQVDPLTIVLPVVGGILFFGLIALIVWKIIQTYRDKHEYQRFIQETSKAKWSAGNNQLYVDPNARVQNPMFIGN